MEGLRKGERRREGKGERRREGEGERRREGEGERRREGKGERRREGERTHIRLRHVRQQTLIGLPHVLITSPACRT